MHAAARGYAGSKANIRRLEAVEQEEKRMQKELVFEGVAGAERFYMLHMMAKLGANNFKERTREMVIAEADVDDLLESIGINYTEAAAAGTIPAHVVKEIDAMNAKRVMNGLPQLTDPEIMPNIPMLLLKSLKGAHTLLFDASRLWKVLTDHVNRAVPLTNPGDARRVRDVLGFLDAAATVDPKKDKPLALKK
jgi:hypothetical protein